MRNRIYIAPRQLFVVGCWACISTVLSLSSCGASSSGAVDISDAAMNGDAQGFVDSSMRDSGADEGTVLSDAEASLDTSSQPDSQSLMEGGPGCNAQSSDACNAPTECGPVVPVVAVTHAAPAATGGTIVSGLYFLTAVNWYTSAIPDASAGTIQETSLLTSSMVSVRAFSDGNEAPPVRGTYTTSGTAVTWMYSCPSTSEQTQSYTATATTFTVYEQPSGTSDVYEFISTKQ
jgi:hypothetical protein